MVTANNVKLATNLFSFITEERQLYSRGLIYFLFTLSLATSIL